MSKKLFRILFWGGIGLSVLAIGLFGWSQISVSVNRRQATALAETLKELIPTPYRGMPDGRSQTEMPVMELEGEDFSALLEIPAYGVLLPVCNGWESSNVQKYPHRFSGSMYDSSLVIGGSDNQGQLACLEVISIGDRLTVTDLRGEHYLYTVAWVEKTEDVSAEHLCDAEYDLTLFVRNTYGFEYTLVRCNLQ